MILPFILALNRAPVFPPQTLLIPFWWGVLNKSHFHAFIPHRLLLCRSGDADFQGASAAVWDPQWSPSSSSQPHYACTQTCPKHRQTGTFTHRPPQQHTVMALWSFWDKYPTSCHVLWVCSWTVKASSRCPHWCVGCDFCVYTVRLPPVLSALSTLTRWAPALRLWR